MFDELIGLFENYEFQSRTEFNHVRSKLGDPEKYGPAIKALIYAEENVMNTVELRNVLEENGERPFGYDTGIMQEIYGYLERIGLIEEINPENSSNQVGWKTEYPLEGDWQTFKEFLDEDGIEHLSAPVEFGSSAGRGRRGY
ncbi:MAG: hypothetical protein ABEJ56_05335 [Candidatus Nanohaloarchaea archaeon]